MTDPAGATPTGPLAGFRILELGANLTAPVATMLMGDQGAEIIKIETAIGDQLRHGGDAREGVAAMGTMFLNANRNKRSVVLDLKRPDHVAAVRTIVAGCDAVVQNFRPGVIDRLGLGYEAIRVVRPDIVYVSIDGVGDTGPDAGRRVYDIVVQGISGFAGVQADAATGEPRTIQNAVVDKATALAVWQATTAALLVRERTGQGQHVRVSMLDVALSFLWPEAMGRSTLIGDDVRRGGAMASMRYCYATADGHILVGFMSADEFAAVARVVGRPDLIDDPRFRTVGDRFANAAPLNDAIAEQLATRPTADWLAELRAADAVFAPVNWPETIADDPQVIATGALTMREHPLVGAYRQPVHPVRFGATPAGFQRHPPTLGADTDAVLAEFGITLAP